MNPEYLRYLATELEHRTPGAYRMLIEFAEGNCFITDRWAYDALERRGLTECLFGLGFIFPKLTPLGIELATFIRQPREFPIQLELPL